MRKLILLSSMIIFSFSTSLAYSETKWMLYSKKCIEGAASLDACNMAVTLMPKDILSSEAAEIFISRGIALGELGRTGETLRSFQQAKRLDRTNAKYDMGTALDQLGYTSKALRAYRKSVKLNPNITETWGNLGVVAYDLERYRESVNAFEKAQQLVPSYFDSRAEQLEIYEKAINVKPLTTAHGREVSLKITPNIGYLGKIEKNVFKQFLYIIPEASVDLQIYKNWFVTGSFLYSRTTDDVPAIDLSNYNLGLIDTTGRVNIYGITFGVKYVLREMDYPSYSDSFLDRSRYWTSVEIGPYITNVSASVSSSVLPDTIARSITAANFGFNAGCGFSYYFHPNFSIGLQFKFHYVKLGGELSTSTSDPTDNAVNNALNQYIKDNDYFILDGGPSLSVRF